MCVLGVGVVWLAPARPCLCLCLHPRAPLQPMFFIGMATVLAKEEVPADLRQLAGLLMKTALDARNDVLRDARATRWLAIDTAVRTQIKNMVRPCPQGPVRLTAASRAVWASMPDCLL